MFWLARAKSNSDAAPRARSLFASYFLTLAIAASLPLLIGVSVEGYVSFTQRQRSDAELRRLEAAQAANEIEVFFRQLATLLADVGAQTVGAAATVTTAERAAEYRRMFTLFRPLLRVTWVDGRNLDVIRLDRREVDDLDGKTATVFGELVPVVRTARAIRFELRDGVNGRKPSLLVAAPGSVAQNDVLVLEFDLRFLSELLGKLHFSNDGFVFVTDEAGRIVGHENTNLALRRVSFAEATQMSGTAARPSDIPLEPSPDNRIVFSGHKLQSPPWIVVAAQPERIATAWVSSTLWRLALLLGTALLLAAVFAAWSARRMTRPISALTESARDLMLGQSVNVRAPSEHRELQQLASQFSQMAQRVTEAQSGLEQKVEEKTRDLANANAALEVASQHKSDFLAHMSHELRTPLNAVIGFSEMLKAQYFGPLNDKQAEYVRDINASGQHLLSLINDILDLAKVEAGRMELVRSDVHLPSLVEACCSLVSERFARKSQTLNTVVDSTVSFWSLDERKVKQCVLNLLSNANKFTPQGGRVSLLVAAEDNALVVRVTDTGVGIAPDALTNLFTEFYQVAPSSAAAGGAATAQSTDAREGTGLGLALTKKFVELHGGTVEVASEVGKGSTFTLRFPAVNGSGAEQAVAS